MNSLVQYRLDGSIATLTMDDGKVNALSPAMLAEINSALDRAAAEQAVVVLAGRQGVFSAGFDLSVLTAGGDAARDMLLGGFVLAERILSYPTPVVIACTGHALAMGVFLVLAGDYRVGAAGAYKIGANEVAIGLTMPWFGVEMCRQRLSPAHYHRAVINAEMFTPEDAVAAGFLDRVVPAENVLDAALEAAEGLGRLDRAVHLATKMRARESALEAIRAAIETDAAELGVVTGQT